MNAPTDRSLAGKTIVMSGGSRGIGLAIALRAARDGANIVLLAKTTVPDSRLQGTIYSAAEQIEKEGGTALPVVGDVRSDDSIAEVVAAAVNRFGAIDICVNNASALDLSPTLDLTAKRYDLMQDVNTRGTFMLTRACLPFLLNAPNPHVLTLSPPLNLSPAWLGAFPGYMLSKFGMTLATLGFAAEFAAGGISANTLWPRTTIATDAVGNLLGGDDARAHSRTPEIMADAAHRVLTSQSMARSGETLIDEDVLREYGQTDFERYRAAPNDTELRIDLFLDR
ncbi:MAG: Dehydrogenase with different specificity [Subtercola sp.]|nr:Dehydrogenase with different specificity [Subtercola sp.]